MRRNQWGDGFYQLNLMIKYSRKIFQILTFTEMLKTTQFFIILYDLVGRIQIKSPPIIFSLAS